MEPFRFTDAREILTPFLDQARSREAVRLSDARRESDRFAGVAWSGLASAEAALARCDQQLRAEAAAACAHAQLFDASPRGRFLAGLEALERAGEASSAERARAAFNRGFADPLRAACPAELGLALAVVGRLDKPPARDVCIALAELLAATLELAA